VLARLGRRSEACCHQAVTRLARLFGRSAAATAPGCPLSSPGELPAGSKLSCLAAGPARSPPLPLTKRYVLVSRGLKCFTRLVHFSVLQFTLVHFSALFFTLVHFSSL
jgi:hypothetical protein